MLKWAIIFAIIALIAAAFGFSGIATGAATVAKILFFIFLVVCLILLTAAVLTGRSLSRKR